MNLLKPASLYLFSILAICPGLASAADIFGNPTLTGNPDRFALQIGGGKSYDLEMDSSKTDGAVQIVGISSGNYSTPDST